MVDQKACNGYIAHCDLKGYVCDILQDGFSQLEGISDDIKVLLGTYAQYWIKVSGNTSLLSCCTSDIHLKQIITKNWQITFHWSWKRKVQRKPLCKLYLFS